MKSKELMIGNYFRVDESIYKITKLSEKGNTSTLVYGENHSKGKGEPIFLNAKWLELLGFNNRNESIGVTYFLEDWSMVLLYDSMEDKYLFRYSILSAPMSRNIRHIHELQNLYFSLTGQELELKEES